MAREWLAPILPVLTVTVGALGACVGSFLNVCIWRLPRRESLLHPGSHCPKCGHAIRPWENIPILSWILLRARCSNCHQPISPRYPLVEAATMLLYLLVWWRVWTGTVPLNAFWGYAFLVSALFAAAVTDLEHMIIPNAISYSGIVAAWGLAAAFPATRLQATVTGVFSGRNQLMLRWALDGLAALLGTDIAHPRAVAVLDAAIGTAVGCTILWAVLEGGRLLWGRTRRRPDTAVPATLTGAGLTIAAEQLSADWEELLPRRTDRFRFRAEAVRVKPSDGADAADPWECGPCRGSATDDSLTLGDNAWRWDELATAEVTLTQWTLPREVMGYGDVKLLAMIGAFLGPDACIFVLLLGALLGTVLGAGLLALPGRTRQTPLPFAPFLAAAAVLVLLFGAPLIRWYGSVLGALPGH